MIDYIIDIKFISIVYFFVYFELRSCGFESFLNHNIHTFLFSFWLSKKYLMAFISIYFLIIFNDKIDDLCNDMYVYINLLKFDFLMNVWLRGNIECL